MKKFRQIAFILMLALSLTTFAACGKKNTDMNDGSNNNSVTENGTDKNGTNDNNVVDDNTVTDNNGIVNDRADTNQTDYGTTGENMRDAAENAKESIEDTGEAIKNGVTGDTDTNRDHKDGTNGKDGLPGKDGRDGRDGKDGVSPDLTNYPDTDAVKALIQAAVQPLLQQAHIHKNLDVLDDLTANELSLLRALQAFEDDTTYNIQTFREAIAALNEKAHTHENQAALDQITAAKIAQWDGFGTQINGLSTKVTVYSEKTERTLESLQKQIDNLTNGRNYTVLFQSGQNAISTYAPDISMVLDGSYQTMTDFLAAYPQFCSAANDFVLSYSQACFNWDKSVLTVCAKPLSLTKNAEIVMSYQSGSSEAGSLYLVQKPQKIDIPIGVYVNTEIDANRAVSLDFQWLQSETFITTITECTGISDGEYYLAWVGRSNNSHPKIRFLKVLEG